MGMRRAILAPQRTDLRYLQSRQRFDSGAPATLRRPADPLKWDIGLDRCDGNSIFLVAFEVVQLLRRRHTDTLFRALYVDEVG